MFGQDCRQAYGITNTTAEIAEGIVIDPDAQRSAHVGLSRPANKLLEVIPSPLVDFIVRAGRGWFRTGLL
jgi:hypothetical protein